VARRATLIRQARQTYEHVLLLDGGNSLYGDTDPALRTRGATSVEIMNMMRYDAMALGAGDMRIGTDIETRIADADFAILSANTYFTGTERLLAVPYVLTQIAGHTVALVGATEPVVTRFYLAVDPVPEVRAIAASLASQADILILLSHAGPEIDRQIAREVPGLDLVIGGRPQGLPDPGRDPASGTVLLYTEAASSGHAGRYIGQGTFRFDAQGTLIDFEWSRIQIEESIPPDPGLDQWVMENL
jgi:5'-nucleotidase